MTDYTPKTLFEGKGWTHCDSAFAGTINVGITI